MDLLLIVALPLLPAGPRERWASRRGLSLLGAAVLSGVLEIAAGGAWMVASYRATVVRWSEQSSTVLGAHADEIEQRTGGRALNAYNLSIYSGTLLFLAFLLTPQGLLSVLTVGEGLVRTAAAAATGECMASMFVAAPWAVQRALRDRARAVVGTWRDRRRPPDRVRRLRGREGPGYLIHCARARGEWTPDSAILIAGAPYRIARQARRERPAGWRYLLRPWPPGEVIRRRVGYQPSSHRL